MAVLKMAGMGVHPNRFVRGSLLLLTSFLVYYFSVRLAHLVLGGSDPHSHLLANASHLSKSNVSPKRTSIVKVTQTPPRIAPPQGKLFDGPPDPKVFSGRNIHRLVHLDLKGAPPKMEYFRKIIPRFREWGATGLLIEYEDMFPYWGSMKVLSRADAYNASDIAELLRLAHENGLMVIPLLQTFGHFEFVLKHGQFSHIREVEDKIKNLNPAHAESFPVVKQMVDQMLSRHPDARYLHIGCDEVTYLGFSKESMAMMREKFLDEKGLFLHHVLKILNYIREAYPKVKPIMWDDMIRKMDSFQLKRNNLARLVEPMVWSYIPEIERLFHTSFWDNYAEVFDHIWTASAFKGATGQDEYVVNIDYHLTNHRHWLTVMEKTHSRHFPTMRFRGLVLTGWQRYDHTLPLCELLPVAVPSLVACLHCITHGGFTPHDLRLVSGALRCQTPLNLSPAHVPAAHARCSFPGSDVYDAVSELKMTRLHIDKFLRWKVRDDAAREVVRRRVLSHVHSLPPVLLAVLPQHAVAEFMQQQVVLGAARLPELRREAQTLLFQLYPWMRPKGRM